MVPINSWIEFRAVSVDPHTKLRLFVTALPSTDVLLAHVEDRNDPMLTTEYY